MKPKCILVGGLSRSGKDTFAESLRLYTGSMLKLQFSGPLKFAASGALKYLNCAYHDFNNEAFKSDPVNRAVLVAIGEAARAQNPDIFAGILAEKALASMELGYHIIVSDWRYSNEAEVVYRKLRDRFSVHTVLVIKENSPAANETESRTVGKLFEDYPGSDFVCANEGDLKTIRQRARELSQDWGIAE